MSRLYSLPYPDAWAESWRPDSLVGALSYMDCVKRARAILPASIQVWTHLEAEEVRIVPLRPVLSTKFRLLISSRLPALVYGNPLNTAIVGEGATLAYLCPSLAGRIREAQVIWQGAHKILGYRDTHEENYEALGHLSNQLVELKEAVLLGRYDPHVRPWQSAWAFFESARKLFPTEEFKAQLQNGVAVGEALNALGGEERE